MANPVIKMEIVRNYSHFTLATIMATYADGKQVPWSDIKTEKGLKRMLTIHAKRNGLVVNGEVATRPI